MLDTLDFQNYLESNNLYFIKNIDCVERFYGIAISQSNNIIIAILNLFVREHNIKIKKMNVLSEIYYADCRQKYSDPIDFNNKEIQDKCIFQYNHIFKN